MQNLFKIALRERFTSELLSYVLHSKCAGLSKLLRFTNENRKCCRIYYLKFSPLPYIIIPDTGKNC